MATTSKTQYEAFAPKYDALENLPCYKLEAQLIQFALGDCSGLHVLDLGGGSGLHARDALAAGAAKVDVVDISPSMMEIGQSIEVSLGRSGRIAWHVADVSRPLSTQDISTSLLRPGEYDIVMANWVLDHAATLQDLKGMWGNVAMYLKPSEGRFLGIRVVGKGLRAGYMQEGKAKYGTAIAGIEEIANGLRYQVSFVGTGQVIEFEATSMEDSYAFLDEIPRQLGITNLELVPLEEMEVVKGDREFWRDFLEDPEFAVVKGRKG